MVVLNDMRVDIDRSFWTSGVLSAVRLLVSNAFRRPTPVDALLLLLLATWRHVQDGV